MARQNGAWEAQVDHPVHAAIRCRNYAEELRIMAADRSTNENRASLLRVAIDYDRMATSFEAIDKAKLTLAMRA
jgi:hypothetical protein